MGYAMSGSHKYLIKNKRDPHNCCTTQETDKKIGLLRYKHLVISANAYNWTKLFLAGRMQHLLVNDYSSDDEGLPSE